LLCFGAVAATLVSCSSGPSDPARSRTTTQLRPESFGAGLYHDRSTGHPAGSAVHPAGSAIPPVTRVTAHDLGKSWHHGCPVGPSQLRSVRVRFWGFDHRSHHGFLIVHESVVHPVRKSFRAMRHRHFPLRRVVPIATYGGSDNRSMRHDNTSAFNCRYAVANGPKTWSMHAYGEAIDIDPRENPYRLNGKILPRSGAPYADRSQHKPGMIHAHSAPVKAFDRFRWGWGGRWASTPDYQHFSVNGK
jgi:hypothetical protein